MNKSGFGIGSASVVLVFVTLCFTILTLISYTAARNGKMLADAEAAMVKSYYGADTLAEDILAAILACDTIPGAVRGVEIAAEWDRDLAAETAEFSCIVSDVKELYVKVALYKDSYDILSWRMRDIREWRTDGDLPVWSGD
jgi:hypothetical protein